MPMIKYSVSRDVLSFILYQIGWKWKLEIAWGISNQGLTNGRVRGAKIGRDGPPVCSGRRQWSPKPTEGLEGMANEEVNFWWVLSSSSALVGEMTVYLLMCQGRVFQQEKKSHHSFHTYSWPCNTTLWIIKPGWSLFLWELDYIEIHIAGWYLLY